MGNGSMPNRPSFGRRAAPRTAPPSRGGGGIAAAPPALPETAPAAPDGISWTSHDAELEDWKRSRRWQIPWRQVSLIASLCFGIASLVLPDKVNGVVQWLLYALTAASFYTGLRKRRT